MLVVPVVTIWSDVEGPLHPEAVAVIVEIPIQPAAKVTSPEVVTIVLPPASETASRL